MFGAVCLDCHFDIVTKELDDALEAKCLEALMEYAMNCEWR